MASKGVALGVLGALFLFSAATSGAQLLHKKKKVNKSTSADNNAQPDKILYDRALNDIKHGRQEVGRLTMQTLINTYPDSEYLAKAKTRGIAASGRRFAPGFAFVSPTSCPALASKSFSSTPRSTNRS